VKYFRKLWAIPEAGIFVPLLVFTLVFFCINQSFLGSNSSAAMLEQLTVPHLHLAQRKVVEGRETRVRSPYEAKANGLGLLTEDRKRDGLLFNFSIRENVTLHDLPQVSRLRLLKRASETSCANHFLEKLSIRAPSVDTPVANLSGGNQQKVVLAKVLFPRPRILFLDEPTKGVDVGAKNEIYKLMMGLAGRGIALVVISSELPELLALSDRIIVLARGRIVDQFTKAEASERRLMLAATGVMPPPISN
jgi:ABC-type sugar transport system ATPase subunit